MNTRGVPGRPARTAARPTSIAAAVGLSVLLLILLAIGGAAGWLGVREWHRNIALGGDHFDQVKVVRTWYKTNDVSYKWRGPVADVEYVTGDAVGRRAQAELLSDRPTVGQQVYVRRAASNPKIAQGRNSPLLWWQDVVPFLVMALAVAPMPAMIAKISRTRKQPRKKKRIIRIEGERVSGQPRQVA